MYTGRNEGRKGHNIQYIDTLEGKDEQAKNLTTQLKEHLVYRILFVANEQQFTSNSACMSDNFDTADS